MLGDRVETTPLHRRQAAPLVLPLPVSRVVAAARSVPMAVWLAGLVLASAALRFAVAAQTGAPWIVPDELIYSELAKSFAATHEFAVRGEPFSAWSYGPLYPVLIAPAYRFTQSSPDAYLLVKAFNCIAMSSAAVPAYLLARRLVSRPLALVLAGLAVAVPSGIYTTKIMTESVSYPIFLWTMLALTAALARPTAWRQIGAFAAIGLAISSRAQMVTLVPGFVAAIVLLAGIESRSVLEGRRRRFIKELAAFKITWSVLGLAGVLGLIGIAMAGRWHSVLGEHAVLSGRIELLDAPRWLVYHVAELDLYVGLLPLVAFVVVAAAVFAGSESSRSLRAFVASTAGVSLCLLSLVAVYASQPKAHPKVYDRYVFYLVPLLFLALLIWFERGLPRPSWFSPLIVCGAALPFVLPFATFLNGREWGVSSSSVGLLPWGILRLATGTIFAVYAGLLVGAIYLTYFFVRSGKRRPLLLFVVSNLIVLNLFAQVGNAGVARNAVDYGIGAGTEKAWIDTAVGHRGKVAVIWSGLGTTGWKGWYAIWESEFFNASVGSVYDLREPMRYQLPSQPVRTRGRALYSSNGAPLVAEYVLTHRSTPVAGRAVAANNATGMVLYRVGGRVRLR